MQEFVYYLHWFSLSFSVKLTDTAGIHLKFKSFEITYVIMLF